ncbi:MAG: helix-turn-helix transcriptional regulator [Bacteroidia bacterium]|nr:helix-turn-helix transcriptional regulator [Bacteroidia bacterium]
MANFKIIGENIQAIRTKMGLSQEALANLIGIHREALSYYENGTREPSLEVLSKIALFLNIELSALFEENAASRLVTQAFAFRAEELTPEDSESILEFRKIVQNYLKMSQAKMEGGNLDG